jgi:hypothetical protein
MPTPPPPPSAVLSPELAFVVQLFAPGSQSPDALAGRAEHIASGDAVRFHSLAELSEFMGRTAHASAPHSRSRT